MNPLRPLLLATRSEGKLRELFPLVEAAGFEAETLVEAGIPEADAEDALETFSSFEENAFAKARYFSAIAPERLVLADDSGLEVLALAGAPGVRSKRWSMRAELSGAALDEANNGRLQVELERVGALTASERRARFVCAAVCVGWGLEMGAVGETAGWILRESRGVGGFGYDGYFFSVEFGSSFGELSIEEKQRVSHRGRAFSGLLAKLSAVLQLTGGA